MDLHAMLDDYLAVRRALGTKLAREEKLLRQFLAWLDGHGRTAITADAALEWARQPGDVSAGRVAGDADAGGARLRRVLPLHGRHHRGPAPRRADRLRAAGHPLSLQPGG